MERITLSIDGMTCGHCVRSVDQALKALDGVAVEQVAIGSATVSYDPATTSVDRLKDAVEDEGYQVTETR